MKKALLSRQGPTPQSTFLTYLPPVPSPNAMQPTPLPPDTRTSFLREELRTRTRRPHPARHIPHAHRRIRSARSGPSGSSSFVLPTVARALAEVEGGLGCCWYDCCCECGSGCEWEDDGDGAEWECWRLVGVGVLRRVLMREAGRKMGRMERRIC